MQVALITGTSTGIGFASARAFARAGHRTWATMRDLSKAEPLRLAAQAEGLELENPNQVPYTALKFALAGASEALAYEVHPMGIRVVLIAARMASELSKKSSTLRCRWGSRPRYSAPVPIT